MLRIHQFHTWKTVFQMLITIKIDAPFSHDTYTNDA